MTNEQLDSLLTECKIGLGMQVNNDMIGEPEVTAFDGVLNQKIKLVISFMRRAGVPNEILESEDAVGVIVMGVGDIWSQNAGEVKYSPAYVSMVTQLALGG